MPRGLVAVLEEKVAVAPVLEARMQVGAERIERGFAGGVKMPGVILETVIRRQIHAAAEPPHRRLAVFHRDKAAHVHVHGGCVGIARMQHQRHPHGFPAPPGQFRPVCAGRRRQLAAQHVREIHPAAFQHLAFFDQPRDAAAAFGALPGIGAERQAVGGFECGDDARLQVEQPGFDGA